MKIKLGFDISQTAFSGGVSTYTKKIAEGLNNNKTIEPTFFYTSLRKPYAGNLKNVKKLFLPPTITEPIFNSLRLPIDIVIGDQDIYHSSDWVQPKTKAKKVTTFHDVVPFKYPQWSTPKIVEVHKRRLSIVEKEIDMVIAVSESTKNDLLKITNIPPEKILVIYEGVDTIFKPQLEVDIAQFKQKYRLPDHFVLAISGVGERRNLERVKQAAKGYELVITRQTIPQITDDEMPLLFAASDVLLYPSLYEGFGLPILEAMAVGIPVITSNFSSMPEIAGEAAKLVNPEDVNEIKEALHMVLKDKSYRQEIISKGFQQSNKFTWEDCVSKHIELYKQLLR